MGEDMYLIPRVIGVSTYAILLILMYWLVSMSSQRKLGKLLFIYTLMLSLMAYKFIPPTGNDLYRLFITMHFYASQDFIQILNTMIQSSTPTGVLYFYIIGQFHMDGLLPAVTAFIFYNNVFYILNKFAIRYSISSRNTALALLFFMSTGSFAEVISGIRTMLGLSIVAVCCYREFVEHKSILLDVVWYVVAAFMHPAVLAAVIIRWFFLPIQTEKGAQKKIQLLVLFIFLSVVICKYGNSFIIAMSKKAIAYSSSENAYSYFWEYVIGGIDFLMISKIEFLKNNFKTKLHNMGETYDLWKFSCIISTIVLASLFVEYNTFHRFVIFNSILCTPILMSLLNTKMQQSRYIYNTKNLVFVTSILMLFIACTRGNLCSLKFFI